jgi:sugar phosphate isomerase/epimerase
MSIKIAINQATLMPCRADEFVRVSAQAGFDAVEFRMDKLEETLVLLSYKELARLIGHYHLKVLAVNALDGATFVPEDNLDLLRKECEQVGRVCEMLESPWVITPSARRNLDSFPSIERIKEISAKRISFISNILKPFGAKLAFEPVGLPEFLVKDLETAQQIIDLSGNPSVGLAPDIHILYCSGTRAESLTRVKSPLCVIHLNDPEDIPLDNQHVVDTRAFPGEGIAGTEAWVKTALDSGYDGYFSLELFSRKLWEMPAKEAARLCYSKIEKYAAPFGRMA